MALAAELLVEAERTDFSNRPPPRHYYRVALHRLGLSTGIGMQSLVAAVIMWLIATAAAQARYVVDNKGRPFPCLLYETGCTVLPPPGAPLQPPPDQRRQPAPPPYVPCGSRCDLLDRA
jgi:hypothetical protein